MFRPVLVLLALVACADAQALTSVEAPAVRARILSNFFASELPPLDAKTHRHFEPAPGVTAEAVTYATQFGTRVPAILYLPKPLPAGEGERNRERKSGTRAHDALKGDEQLARQRVVAKRGKADGVFDFTFVPDVSHRPFFVTKPVALWLHRQLQFPNWSDAKIAALPETRIGDWAAANSVPMDRLYATEEREGGTRALGRDFPGFKREDLSVLSAAEWEARRDVFVLEAWEKAARATSALGRAP